MLRITPDISIDDSEIRMEFVRSDGPGGQNVNKVSTAVELRFDVAVNESLPPDVKQRLTKLAGRRISAAGVLVIRARRYRTQGRNRQDAVDRLIALIRRAATSPRPRRATKPTAASKRRRLDTKQRRSRTKQLRRTVSGDDQ